MSFAKLTLGHQWGADEWPKYVEVDHNGGRGCGPRRYAPVRTCRNVHHVPEFIFECSECGAKVYPEGAQGVQVRYCPSCGARVVSA